MRIEALKFILSAQDMSRAVAFYRDALGLLPTYENEHWSELKWGDATLALHGGGTGEHKKSGLSVQVDDVEAACRAVTDAGGRVVAEPEERPGEPIRLARVVDTEGNEFAIMALRS